MIGVYTGRFQPFHKGHQVVLEKIAEELDEVIVVVGSAQISHTPDNPFTAGERIAMISASLGDLRRKCYLIPLQDVERNSLWVSHLCSMTPPFDRVFSNNPLVMQLFLEAGFEVSEVPMYQREKYSGTAIRQLMLEGGDWRSLVPTTVADVIDSLNGVKRLRAVCKTDYV